MIKFKSEVDNLNKIMPSYIDNTNPKYVLIDDMYFACLLVVNYSRNQESFFVEKIIKTIKNINISFFYEKQDSYKVIRDLTYHIGNANVTIKSSGDSIQDFNNIASTLEDAKYIRKQMQIDKEELYYLYMYILTYAKTKEELEENIRKIESTTNSVGIYTRRANFRQMQVLNSILPLMYNSEDLAEITKRNVLSKDLACTYPFVMSQIYDNKGILYGINNYDNSPTIINIFNREKYKNSNICIFGSSGSRKIIFNENFNFKK